ncbi:hypothetical protein [Aliarcobacter lanthieri]|uniref:hypothetical protein n=1 Tax=Aliarcobacter lanthieri TaxID=1355374 RepID=UPI00047AF64D|nr:hypothetical protein [Aliarcobacter lanthieri]QKF59283.1 F-type type IV conjugative transfer system protein TraW [Aliarcobacter lanthieri]
MVLNKIVIVIISLSAILLSTTYEIKEQDLILEIENKAPELEKKIEEQKKVIIEKIDNLTGETLFRAKENRTKYIDPTYVLDKDIPKYNKFGNKEGVLYKKGYTFNPIDFMSVLPPDFIVFNACDSSESEYVKNIMKEYEEKSKDYMLVNSGCKNKDLKKTEFNSKVYFLTKEMKDKFEIEHTVSIIYIDKDKKRIAVKEVVANDEKDNN